MAYNPGQSYALIGQEETFGTAVSATKDVGLISDISPTTNKNLKKLNALGSTSLQATIQGKFEHSGTINAAFQHGRLLEYIFGTVAHSAADTPDIKHTFTASDTLPSLTLEYGCNATSDTTLTYEGVRLGTVRISVPSIDEEVKISADFLAEDMNTGTSASSAVLSTLVPLAGSMASFKIASGAASEVQSCEFTINRGTNALYGIGSQNLSSLEPTDLSVDFTATLGFANKSEADRILASDEFVIELDVDNGTAAGSGKRQLYLKLKNCSYASHSISSSVGDYVYVDISGHGKLDSCYSYDNIVESSW